jgi:cytoskeletal protein CcmA (bactofilin family)
MFSKNKDGKAGRKDKPCSPTIISEDMTITGAIDSEGEVMLDGCVEGEIASGRISVGQTGKIVGSLSAENVVVHGFVDGQIRGGEVTLSNTATVTGDIYHETLIVESGAQLDGQCRPLSALDVEGAPALNLVVSDGISAKS